MKLSTIDPKKAYRIIIGISIVLAGVFLLFLPDKVPMQWASDGSVNYTLPKFLAVLVLPILTGFFAFRGWNRHDYSYLGSCILTMMIISGLFAFISFAY